MNITGNTILITGGGSGIGLGLAQALLDHGNTVLIASRSQRTLDAAVAAHPGLHAYPLDVTDPASIQRVAAQVAADHPTLNVLINNAGIMLAENLLDGTALPAAEATVTTNLLGPVRVTQALLPHLLTQPSPVIVNVTSGLASIPLTRTPTYSATKAALRSYTESLRHQLRGTPAQVIELAPPYVATELMPGGSHDPHAMPLNDFIEETMTLLARPGIQEVLVERVLPLRNAALNGTYAQVFRGLNGE
ncbi:SDR family oxidoreductase [Deinococcus radiotolerans]|uniref:Oxidoreductase n=1 Tax=Deinococcus radiotolerans TaxID=1309407 RepID=A0ABQ2FJU4_9DEIO|nr:SDR family NAD(P)-dependent oxidoreductase [Deinococcus radiotolerans]GGL02042.1 oxidoreductase [Deinococcus radiotolerans]